MQVGAPFERVGVDLTGPWPKSNGQVYVLTFIDHFTKWADAIAIPNKEAETVAKALVSRILVHVGVPLQILSDQGKEWDNNLMAALCNRLGIDKQRTTPYHAATNGCVERLHKSINSMLSKCVSENQKDWSKRLPYVMSAYRSAIHESTGYSPNFMHFGREVRAPVDVVLQQPSEQLDVNDFVDRVQRNIYHALNLARTQLGTQTARRKQYYDMKLTPKPFRVNDWVWYFYPRRRTGRSPKWQRLYTGPFLVIDQAGPVNFIIQKNQKSNPLVVHMDKLKLCESNTPRSWLDGDSSTTDAEILETTGADGIATSSQITDEQPRGGLTQSPSRHLDL